MRIDIWSLIAVATLCVGLQNATAQQLVFPQIEGWQLSQDGTVYNPNNLFDVIDGAADLFLEYDFQDLHIGRYAKDDLEVKAELYKHGSAVDAFGIYSQERFPDYHFIDLGLQGYIEKGSLNFLSGMYYVKISTIQEGPAAQDAMLLVAKAIEKHLQQEEVWPAMLAFFPAEKKKAYSEQYIAKNFLGYSSLNRTFVASYDNGTSYKVFVIRFRTQDEATKALDSFIQTLPKSATKQEKAGKLEIRDPNNGLVEVVVSGYYLFGAACPEGKAGHDTFIAELRKRLLSTK
jgi:hypothetical protein